MQKRMNSDTIERYLRNELSTEELSDFTFQMVMNPTLRQEVEKTRLIFKTLQTNPLQEGNVGNNYFLIGAGLVLIMVLLSALFFLKNSTEEGNSIPKDKLIFPTEQPANVPIAAAFKGNEYIEKALGMRSTDESVKRFTVQFIDKQIQLSGEFAAGISMAKLTIWNNQNEDFLEERFVVATNLNIEKEGKVEAVLNYSLEKGLYYFQIEIEGKTEKIGQFEVQ